jgi:DNA polymerase/3'-5' exonuclease PolX
MATLPKCAASGCDNAADPRMFAHDYLGRLHMVCDGHSPLACPGADECVCPALAPSEATSPPVDWQARAIAAEGALKLAAEDGVARALPAAWEKKAKEWAERIAAVEQERERLRIAYTEVARIADENAAGLAAAEKRAEEAEGLLRDAAKAVDALCLATGQRRDLAERIEVFLAAPKENP